MNQTKKELEFSLSKETDNTIELIKTLSNELLNLLRIEENDKTKNMEENLARIINYMSGVLYNQLRSEKSKIKESKLNEFSSYIQAEKILLDNIDELRENMYAYTYKIKRKLREIQAYRKKPINQYDKNGNLIQRWDSMRDAAYTLNINEQNISACCRHVLKTAYGFVWEYADNMQT